MADLHKTRHQLYNKRTGMRPTTTNATKPTQGETSLTIPQGNTTLQNDPEDNTYTTNKGTHRPQHLCRCGLGRMPKHKKINKWIHRDNDSMMGSVVQFGSRTQAVVALSSAESELYAIGTGAQEGLHIANFIKEATTTKTTKVNIRIHTDSTSGKSIATRIVSSKKAKHIDLKYIFIQQLVQSGILSIHKISTQDNPADILTKYVPAEVLNKRLYMAGIQCSQHHN